MNYPTNGSMTVPVLSVHPFVLSFTCSLAVALLVPLNVIHEWPAFFPVLLFQPSWSISWLFVLPFLLLL
jgi:hypothetical protein